ncbi:riboflavin synthase [Parasporobacterium paucivorans]|uniref:Riboflavin synthase n=1 Tax=Parasporobacterium paucivorans DSM 15970 TaxID=1122934 RepID=A0A1M6KQE4_9FIRM|nr:riboflavin synthase [Parasporobacterium paucivorans]SHJ61149.1 riboflavin synthase alpha chain [Parasporobacterium paucivorans DSM 15970]
MFTGIIEETGTIRQIQRGVKSSSIAINADKVLDGTQVGESIAVNGVCLTVTGLESGVFTADVMAETLRRSNLGELNPGSPVNLERAMCLGGRLGGHLVSGHIDGTGTITNLVREDNAVWVSIRAEENILRYVIEKGSIAIDGISLTVAGTEPTGFKVSVIPHTGKETILLKKKINDTVNLECDVIGKYVEKLLYAGPQNKETKKQRITENFLQENGFV